MVKLFAKNFDCAITSDRANGGLEKMAEKIFCHPYPFLVSDCARKSDCVRGNDSVKALCFCSFAYLCSWTSLFACLPLFVSLPLFVYRYLPLLIVRLPSFVRFSSFVRLPVPSFVPLFGVFSFVFRLDTR